MFYTVGLKRKLFFGWKKYKVTGHKWDMGRLILDLTTGSQLHIPGLRIKAFRVYSDITRALDAAARQTQIRHDEHYQVEQNRAMQEAQFRAQQGAYQAQQIPGAAAQQIPAGAMPAPVVDSLPTLRTEENRGLSQLEEAGRRAGERVRGVLQSNPADGIVEAAGRQPLS